VVIRTLALVLLVSASATAEEHGPPLTYLAANGCPSREAFLTSVERRGASWEAQTTRTFELHLERDANGFVGKLAVKQADGTSSDERNIVGKSCAEVAEALSFTLALELNSAAESEKAGAREPAEPPPPVSPPQAEVTPEPPRRATVSRWGHGISRVSEGKLHWGPQFAATLSGGVSFGLFPFLSTRYDAVLRMAQVVTLPNGERKLTGPILRGRLGFMGAPQQSWSAQGASVTVSGQSMGLGLCWSPLYDASGLVLLGCGELGLAGYSMTVEDERGVKRSARVSLLGTVGPSFEAEYGVGPLLLVARAGGNVVFGSLEAQREDGETLFRAKKWEAFVSLGLGGRW
jgi:hypothetical protein